MSFAKLYLKIETSSVRLDVKGKTSFEEVLFQ
jgi:hypothetical protein